MNPGFFGMTQAAGAQASGSGGDGFTFTTKSANFRCRRTDSGTVFVVTSGTVTCITDFKATSAGNGFWFGVYNQGSGAVTIDPNGSEAILTPSGSASTLVLAQGEGVQLVFIGAGWCAFSYTAVSSGGFGEGCRVYNGSNQSINTDTDTAITFGSERYDTDTFHDTGSNTSRITIPSGLDGKYLIGGNVRWENNTGAQFILMVRLGGSTIIAKQEQAAQTPDPIGVTQQVTQCITTVYDLAATNYVELVVRQKTGGAINVEAASNYSPEFWAHRIGA